MRTVCDLTRYDNGQRCQQCNCDRQHPVDVEHEQDRTNDHHDAGEELREAHQQAIGDLLYVRHDGIDQFAVFLGIQETDRHRLKVIKRLRTYITDNVISNVVICCFTRKLSNRCHNDRRQKQDDLVVSIASADASELTDVIDHGSDGHNGKQLCHYAYEGHDHRKRNVRNLRCRIFHQLTEGLILNARDLSGRDRGLRRSLHIRDILKLCR